MDEALWAHRPPPQPPAARSEVWHGEPASTAELTVQRGQLRSAVFARADPAASELDDVDRLLLAFEELGTNGLRHGNPPVQMDVTTTATGWILDVSDAAVDRPPAPDPNRDAADGGMGLFIVAKLCDEHGWDVLEGRKHVWGSIDFGDTHAPRHGASRRLRRRDDDTGPCACH